jgi:CBS domain-containing protein
MPESIVREIMRSPAPTLHPDDSIAVTAKTLADSGLAAAPVVENGVVIGIVTDKDLIQRTAEISMPSIGSFLDAVWVADGGRDFDDDVRHALATTARQLMTHPVINIRDIATLEETATVMMDRNVSTLPVLDASGALIGIVTRTDLVRVIAKLENDTAGA